MIATATREKYRTKTSFEKEELSFDILKKHIDEQDRLISLGKAQHKLVYGFTPRQQRKFDTGISVEEYFANLDRNV
ncbi:MAG: hypothetical protein LBN27_11355 [Prevotellaceae bacterium]|jgi:hypothetical protein|nr:hypothetical protein [Prevotellaceae bacterium]